MPTTVGGGGTSGAGGDVTTAKKSSTPSVGTQPERLYFHKPETGAWFAAVPKPGRAAELESQGWQPVTKKRYETERYAVGGGGAAVTVGGALMSPEASKAISGAIEEVKTTQPSATSFQFYYKGTSPMLGYTYGTIAGGGGISGAGGGIAGVSGVQQMSQAGQDLNKYIMGVGL